MGIEDFIEYCRRNCNSINGKSGSDSYAADHYDEMLKVFNNPGMAGMRRVREKFKEVRMLDESGLYTGDLDIVFFGELEVCLCQVNISDSTAPPHGVWQLKKFHEHARSRFGVFPGLVSLQKSSRGFIRRDVQPDVDYVFRALRNKSLDSEAERLESSASVQG